MEQASPPPAKTPSQRFSKQEVMSSPTVEGGVVIAPGQIKQEVMSSVGGVISGGHISHPDIVQAPPDWRLGREHNYLTACGRQIEEGDGANSGLWTGFKRLADLAS